MHRHDLDKTSFPDSLVGRMNRTPYIRFAAYAVVIACVWLYESGVRVIPVTLEADSDNLDGVSGRPRPSRCAFGHATLREIEAVYGLLVDESDELKAKFHNLELWRGGCVIGPWSKDTKLVCTTCRYAFDDFDGTWDRDASLDELKGEPHMDFSAFIEHVPVKFEPHENSPARYEMRVKGDKVWSESCRYWTKGTADELQTVLRAYLESRRLEVKTRKRKAEDCEYFSYARLGARYVTVTVAQHPPEAIHVAVTIMSPAAAAEDTTLWLAQRENSRPIQISEASQQAGK